MATPAQIAANQANSKLSTGPRSPESKALSARNSLKHGMSGEGRALPQSDLAAVAEKTAAYLDEFHPRTVRGTDLVKQMAMLMVRMERIGQHSVASSDSRSRNAARQFDEAREDEAQALLDGIADQPRANLRKLMRMPEGVERLREDWRTLRDRLTREYRPNWTPADLGRASLLLGLAADDVDGNELAEPSERLWTEPDPSKAAQVRLELAARIDAILARLVEHEATLDHDQVAHDREEAGLLARFDPSKAMDLMHRYESDASRRYARCLKELREAEGPPKAESRPKSSPPPAPRPEPAAPELASFGEGPEIRDEEPAEPPQTRSRPDSTPKNGPIDPKSTPRTSPPPADPTS